MAALHKHVASTSIAEGACAALGALANDATVAPSILAAGGEAAIKAAKAKHPRRFMINLMADLALASLAVLPDAIISADPDDYDAADYDAVMEFRAEQRIDA